MVIFPDRKWNESPLLHFVYILMMPSPRRLFIEFLSRTTITGLPLKALPVRCSQIHFAVTNINLLSEQREDLIYSRISCTPSVLLTYNYDLSEKISVGRGQGGKSFMLKD